MRFDYKIIFIITALLFTLSTTLTALNYIETIDSTREQLKESSLPLTVDNIYTEIQKQIIEPNLIASMMSHDTFMKSWLTHEENDVEQITQYLETIQNKYKMFTAFLVSDKSRNYYTSAGILEQVTEDNTNNAWYFNFKKHAEVSEINIDYNEFMDEALIMFINHKIYDDEFHMLGATGVGLKTSYINDMLKYFRQRYNFNVYFINESGNVVISEQSINSLQKLSDLPVLNKLMADIISKENQLFEYDINSSSYLLTTKYIEELDLYLLVEAKVDNFTQTVTETFYFNLVISSLITSLITILILLYVRRIHGKLNDLASNDVLTGLPNRRALYNQLAHLLLIKKRNKNALSTIFIDVDNFKQINDVLGHDIGDKVLVSIANLLKSQVRETDFLARWGGEEFIILLADTPIAGAKFIAEQIRETIAKNNELFSYADKAITISLGITQATENDDVNSIFKRADDALYQAKDAGRNTIIVN